MAKADERVLAAVEQALKAKPDATVDELLELAKGIDKNVGKLTKRQFHARYPLQVKRRLAPPRKRKAGRKKSVAGRATSHPASMDSREAVRASFLKFAQELAAAEGRKDVVKVVASVDRYVDEVIKVLGRK